MPAWAPETNNWSSTGPSAIRDLAVTPGILPVDGDVVSDLDLPLPLATPNSIVNVENKLGPRPQAQTF